MISTERSSLRETSDSPVERATEAVVGGPENERKVRIGLEGRRNENWEKEVHRRVACFARGSFLRIDRQEAKSQAQKIETRGKSMKTRAASS